MRKSGAIMLIRIALGLTLLPLEASLPAPPVKTPFHSLDIGLQIATNTNREELHDYWKSYPAFGGLVETPFHIGIARAGILIHPFSAASAKAYDYTDSFVYLGLGIPFIQARHVSWQNAVNLGIHFMLFTNPESQNNDESEMGVGFVSQLKYRFSSHWSITLAYNYNRIYTWKRINLAYFSGSLSYKITTPGWLRNFLE